LSHDCSSTNITRFCFDLNTNILEFNLSIIKPDIVIHLAGISSANYALKNPIETIQTNGLVVSRICEIIHKNKWQIKLFNASSSEIYKGHINYLVNEDDNYLFHLHPYSISKIMGHSMVDFYRKTYNLPFSNGILFTIESPLKRNDFLLNKVVKHAKQWTRGKKEPLLVGPLESYRTILHASDAARAIKKIVDCNGGDTYLICNNDSENIKVIDLVIKIYKEFGITVEQNNDKDQLIDTLALVPIVIIDKQSRGFDTIPTNIRGNCQKLLELGWQPEITVDDIIKEMVNKS
jgi:GDP-mannose 4,6-dehydratase